ncbi:MAG: NBR1-Ig-like domain-containing protein [Brevefilum sp.]
MKKNIFILSIGLAFSLVLTGCNLPGRATPTSQVDMLNTAAAQTIQAQQTNIAQTNQPANGDMTPTATLEPPADGTPTTTPEPTATLNPSPTNTPEAACNKAAFVSETIPDGTDFEPGKSFNKTWTLRNDGSCSWTAEYDVVFVKGDSMDAPAATSLTSETVAPGETVKISIDLKAPVAAGTHRGDFKLRNQHGVIFGIGEEAKPFWVEIDVVGTLYNFTKNVCASGVTWTSGAGTLPCPGSAGDADGWVLTIDEPFLENGAKDNEPGIQVRPEAVNDGWIKGTFPEISVTEGVIFRSIIGCYDDYNCDVKFKLNYKIDGGSEKTLATWHEVQDETFNRVEVDLSSLAGEKVQFILRVEANGSPASDRALWFGPRIEPED